MTTETLVRMINNFPMEHEDRRILINKVLDGSDHDQIADVLRELKEAYDNKSQRLCALNDAQLGVESAQRACQRAENRLRAHLGKPAINIEQSLGDHLESSESVYEVSLNDGGTPSSPDVR